MCYIPQIDFISNTLTAIVHLSKLFALHVSFQYFLLWLVVTSNYRTRLPTKGSLISLTRKRFQICGPLWKVYSLCSTFETLVIKPLDWYICVKLTIVLFPMHCVSFYVFEPVHACPMQRGLLTPAKENSL